MADFREGTEEYKQPVDTHYNFRRERKNHLVAGLFVLGVGLVFLLKQSGVLFPFWFFTWPVFLIAFGLLKGIKDGLRPGGWLFIVAVGGIFLADRLIPDSNIQRFAWPLIIMAVGVWIMVKPKSHFRRGAMCMDHNRQQWGKGNEFIQPQNIDTTPVVSTSSDILDTTSVFGGIKKIILSKDFRGGDVVNFMGGTEINLTQADIRGRVTIEATNIFGGTKLIIPSTWDVQSDVMAIFGGVDDKRQFVGEAPDPHKIIHLSGTCLFGGIEIRSF
jgi:predicted membrane protein